MVAVINTLAINSDKTQLIDYPKWIKNDPELSPRTKDFQLAIFEISIEQNNPCPLVSDELIAQRMNITNTRGVRRYIKLSIDKNKIIKFKAEEKHLYRLAFSCDPNSTLAVHHVLKLNHPEVLSPPYSDYQFASDTISLLASEQLLVNIYQNNHNQINDQHISEQNLVNIYQKQNSDVLHKKTDHNDHNNPTQVAQNQHTNTNKTNNLSSFGKDLPKLSPTNKLSNTEKPKFPSLHNNPTQTTTPTAKPFKAFKAFSSSLDLDFKEKESLSLAGEINRTDSTNDGYPTNTTENISNNVDEKKNNSQTMERFAQQQETAEGIIYNRSDVVTLPDPKCKYCLGKARLFKLTGEDKTKETLCICCKLYILEPLINEQKKVLVGTPKLTPSELALQTEIVSTIDHCEIIDQSKLISMPNKVSSLGNTEPKLAGDFDKQTKLKEEIIDKNLNSKDWKAKSTQKAKVSTKETDEKQPQTPTNSILDTILVRKEDFPYIDKLNQNAHLRLNNKGEADLEIPSSKCGKYWLLPNPYNQDRKSAVSFWQWLVYALREPNRSQPIRLACSRYYLGDKDQEILLWLKERATSGSPNTSFTFTNLAKNQAINIG